MRFNCIWQGLDIPEKPNTQGGGDRLEGDFQFSHTHCSSVSSGPRSVRGSCPALLWPEMMVDANSSLMGWALSLVLCLSLGNWEKGRERFMVKRVPFQLQAGSCEKLDGHEWGTLHFISLIELKISSFLENILTATLKYCVRVQFLRNFKLNLKVCFSSGFLLIWWNIRFFFSSCPFTVNFQICSFTNEISLCEAVVF